MNTSDITLVRPLKLRMVTLSSGLGLATARATENGTSGPGAIWDLSMDMAGGRLKPGDRTRPKKLTFALASVRPFRGDRDRRLPMLQFDAKAYGTIEEAGRSK